VVFLGPSPISLQAKALPWYRELGCGCQVGVLLQAGSDGGVLALGTESVLGELVQRRMVF